MKIAVYDEKEYINLNTDDLDKYDKGKEGIVYFYKDLAIKIYHTFPKKCKLNFDDVKFLSKIETKRILLPRSGVFKIGDNKATFNGYVTKRINNIQDFKEVENLSGSKFIKELQLIKKDINILTQNKIQIRDMEHKNNILYNGNIYYVDPGSFIKNTSSILSVKNYEEVSTSLKKNVFMHQNNNKLLMEEVDDIITKKYGKYNEKYAKNLLTIIKEIYNFDYHFNYRFSKYKNYLDYIISILEQYDNLHNYKSALIENVIENRSEYRNKENIKVLKNLIK